MKAGHIVTATVKTEIDGGDVLKSTDVDERRACLCLLDRTSAVTFEA